MSTLIRSAKSLLSPTSESPSTTNDLTRPDLSPFPSDTAVPSLGHDGVYGYEIKSKAAVSVEEAVVPETTGTGKINPSRKMLSRDSAKSKKKGLEISPVKPLEPLKAVDPPDYHATVPRAFYPNPDVVVSPTETPKRYPFSEAERYRQEITEGRPR